MDKVDVLWKLLVLLLVIPVTLGVLLNWFLRRRASKKGEKAELGWTGALIITACWVTAMIVILVRVV